MSPEAVAAEARSWKSTPFHHQGHLKGVGCDCAGLVGGVAVSLGLVPADFWETSFAPFAGYGEQPHDGALISACDAFMPRIPVPEADIGDVLGMRFATEPQHLAIMVDYPGGQRGIVHALFMAGKVVEHRLSGAWRARITHAWRMPGVAWPS